MALIWAVHGACLGRLHFVPAAPVPGGPTSKMPAGERAPRIRKRRGFFRNCTTSWISALTCAPMQRPRHRSARPSPSGAQRGLAVMPAVKQACAASTWSMPAMSLNVVRVFPRPISSRIAPPKILRRAPRAPSAPVRPPGAHPPGCAAPPPPPAAAGQRARGWATLTLTSGQGARTCRAA